MSITEGLKRGTIEIMLLNILKDNDLYGYQICQEFEKRSNGLFQITEGSLYPVLYRLLDKGYISDRKELVGKRRTRVYYRIESEGLEYLKKITEEYVSLNRGILFALGYGDLEVFLDGNKNCD
ncbi:MAG: PadR family transcriptional regulator [Clostridia bacterium]|nr:PadR family transcriptional regulator [Clostridia bacterium]